MLRIINMTVVTFSELKTLFGKSLAVNKALPAGHIISISDLESKKPGNMGIPARNYQSVIGKKLRTAKQQWDFLKEEDF
jgi:N,N'-diacetyllegionaminate synthase